MAPRLGGVGLALSVPVVLATCGDEGGRTRGIGFTEGDSAGIHIVENPSPDALPSLTVGSEPTLGIGRLEGASEEQRYQVSAAVRLSDGRIAVANAGSRELRIYGADGDHLTTAGGAGRPLGAIDTLGAFGEIRQQYVRIAPGPRGVSATSQTFSVSTAWAEGPPDGTVLVADSERPEFHLFRGDGAHVLVRWAAEREPLTDEEWEAWKERQRGSSWAKDRLPALERAWAEMEVPERQAAYGRNVAIGQDGSVWMRESSDIDPGPAAFLVFEPGGRLRGRATLPGPFRVMDAGADWVLGVWLDANGVEFLRRWAIGS